MVNTKKTLLFISFAILSAGLLFSCGDDDDEPDSSDGVTRAQIIALNADGQAVPRANVLLSCESSLNRPCDIEIGGQTDEDGLFEREFDLPKVLKVDAYKIINDTTIEGTVPDTTQTITRDSLCGQTYISILEGETSRQTVTLFSCN